MNVNIHDEFLRLWEEIANFDISEFAASLDPSDFPIPTLIPAGEGSGYVLSKAAVQALDAIARQIHESKVDYQEAYSASDFLNLTSECVGTIISNLSDDKQDWTANFELPLKEEIEARHSRKLTERIFFFGAILISPPEKLSIDIGPCRIVDRHQWLTEQLKQKLISSVSARRIKRTWTGVKLRPTKNGKRNHTETAILKSIGKCDYVICVQTNGSSVKQMEERATQCARIALLVVALFWQRPSSPMENFTLAQDLNRRIIYTGSIDVKRNLVICGSKSKHTFPHNAPTIDWQNELPKLQPIFDVFGRALKTQCDHAPPKATKEIYENIFQVLTLIYRGSIEPEPLFATALIGAAIDMLTGGKGSGGIAKLIEQQLGKSKNDALFSNGTTTGQFITKVYNIGRSRTLHGSNPELKKDWSENRMQAEVICRILLLQICDELHRDPNIVGLKHFMSKKNLAQAGSA